MANKEKRKVPNRILEIRNELQYSQKEFGEILGVSERMICNYETDENNLPIDKAILISEKWNYDLDWIYKQDKKHTKNIPYPERENPNFLVDIRDFIHKDNDKIIFSIPNYYWKYIIEISKIKNSSLSISEKKRAIAKENGNYIPVKKEDFFWELSLDANKFISNMYIGKQAYPFELNEEKIVSKPTDEQIAEAEKFLDSLFSLYTS